MNLIEHKIKPVYNKESRILILGSFPSVKSRAGQFFYHHPQNRFWKVLAALRKVPVPITVPEKKKFLKDNGIAVWDVIKRCEIKGSSDSSIANVVPADLDVILSSASIQQIFINGNKAYELYERYCKDRSGRDAIKLPSSSPANAAYSLERLIDEWSVINQYLKPKLKPLDPEIVPALLNWYDHHARILPWREESTPYRVWVSEIMLQQTRVEAVKPYFDRFMNALPTLSDLAEVEEDQLMKLWEGLGYYNRARNLKRAAMKVMDSHNGVLPCEYEQLLDLPGIGEYTAGAIGSVSYGLPVPAVDGNVLRVITRLLGSYEDILKASTKKDISEQVRNILPAGRVGDFNQALMELGAVVCIPNGKPKCEECPWDTKCIAYQNNLTGQIPVKTPKKPRRIEQKTVFLLMAGNKIALHKRPDKGLLAKLWEFPNVSDELALEGVKEQLEKWNLTAQYIEPTHNGKHVFSHIEWHMCGYIIEVAAEGGEDFAWVSKEEIDKQYAIPTAFSFILEQLKSS